MLLLFGSTGTHATATPSTFTTAFVAPAIIPPSLVISQTADVTILAVTAGTLVVDHITAATAEIRVDATTVLPTSPIPRTVYATTAMMHVTAIHSYLNYSTSTIYAPSITPTVNFNKGLLLTWFMRVTFGTTVQYYSPADMTPVTAQNDWGLSLVAKQEIIAYMSETGERYTIPLTNLTANGENYGFAILLR